MLNKLKQKAKKLIQKNQDNAQMLAKLKIIQKLLEFDDCFLCLSVEEAFEVFKNLQIKPKDYESLYLALTQNI